MFKIFKKPKEDSLNLMLLHCVLQEIQRAWLESTAVTLCIRCWATSA